MTLEECDAKITALTLQLAQLTLKLEAATSYRRQLIREAK